MPVLATRRAPAPRSADTVVPTSAPVEAPTVLPLTEHALLAALATLAVSRPA